MDSETIADMPEELTTGDIARIRGWSRVHAWRWVQTLRNENGNKIVRWRGRRCFVRREELVHALNASKRPIDQRIIARFRALEERVTEVERRSDAHANVLSKIGGL